MSDKTAKYNEVNYAEGRMAKFIMPVQTFYYYNGHTYTLTSDALTWHAAQQEAIALGGYLVSINDKAENDWITSKLMPIIAQSPLAIKSGIQKGTAWIGYSEKNIEGTWVWEDNSNSIYTNWFPGEPNNTMTAPSGEDVTHIYADGTWNDLNSNLWSLIGIIELPYSLVTDSFPPKITSFSPSNQSIDVAVNKDIVLTFDEAIEANKGILSLKTISGSLIESYDIKTSKNISLSGNTVIINPTSDLLPNTTYILDLPSGFVKDFFGNSYQSGQVYGFTTLASNTTINSGSLTGATIISIFKEKYNLSINRTVENIYAGRLQKVIDDNSNSSADKLQDLLVNAMLKLSLLRNSIVSLVDNNGDAKIGTISEINSAKTLLKDLFKGFATETTVDISSKNQIFDASGKNFVFNLNPDLDTTIFGFSKGDKINIIPSISTESDILIYPGISGDGQISLVVLNDATTNLIQLTGIDKILDVSNISFVSLQQAFGDGFIY